MLTNIIPISILWNTVDITTSVKAQGSFTVWLAFGLDLGDQVGDCPVKRKEYKGREVYMQRKGVMK